MTIDIEGENTDLELVCQGSGLFNCISFSFTFFHVYDGISSFVLAVEDNSLRSSFSQPFAPPPPPHFLAEIISCLSHFGGARWIA